MSNLIKAINFLKAAPDKRFLVITNDNQNVGPEQIFLKDIPNEDLAGYIKLNIGHTVEPKLVWVECRKIQGATHVKAEGFSVNVQATNPVVENQPATQTAQVIQPTLQPQFLGNPGTPNNQVFGLGFAEVMNMQRNTDRLGDVKEILEETKAELKEIRHAKNLLEIDHRNVLTKLATAEGEKTLALMIAKNENRSFVDSPAFEKLMEKVPDMMEKFAVIKGANFEAAGQLGNPNISETKSGFIEIVTDNLEDNEVNFLGSICHFIKNPTFISEVSTILKKYNNA